MKMKLMYAPPSPFARKARVAAIELGLMSQIDLQMTTVVPGQPNRAYGAAVNPLRKIPALVLDDSSIIHDSTVICDYLDNLVGGGRLIPAKGPARWQVLTRHSLAQGMCEAIILVRYETYMRPEALRWQAWIDDQWDKVFSGLDWFEANSLSTGATIDLAEITLGCLLGYLDFRWPDVDWRARYGKLADWYTVIEKRESFAATVPVQPPPAS